MDLYNLCTGRTPFYPKQPRNDYNMMLNINADNNNNSSGLNESEAEHLCRKFKEKDMNFGKKIWYLGETIRKLYDIDRDPERKKFLDEYFNFMRHKGSAVTKIPVVAKLPLDLFRLYQVVQNLGGFAQVVKKRRWSQVVRQLDLPSSITSAAFTLRTQYMRLLYPFECEKKGILKQIRFYDDDIKNPRCWSPDSSLFNDLTSQKENEHEHLLLREQNRLLRQEELKFTASSKNDSYETRSNDEMDIPMEQGSPVPNPRRSPVIIRRSKSAEVIREKQYDDFAFYNSARPQSLDNHYIASKQEFKEQDERTTPYNDSNDNYEKSDAHNVHASADNPSKENETHMQPPIENTAQPVTSAYRGQPPSELPSLDRSYETMPTKDKYRDDFLPDLYNRDVHSNRFDSYSFCEGNENRDTPCPCRKCTDRLYDRRTTTPPYMPYLPPTTYPTRSSYSDTLSRYYADVDPMRFYQRSLKNTNYKKGSFMNHKTSAEGVGYNASKYKSPYPTSCSGEMNIKIEERTDTAIALTIAVDGISYTGTLLSKLR